MVKKETPILDFGYIASEITATNIIDAQTGGSHLAIQSGFYEFTKLEETDNPTQFFMAHQLEIGQKFI